MKTGTTTSANHDTCPGTGGSPTSHLGRKASDDGSHGCLRESTTFMFLSSHSLLLIFTERSTLGIVLCYFLVYSTPSSVWHFASCMHLLCVSHAEVQQYQRDDEAPPERHVHGCACFSGAFVLRVHGTKRNMLGRFASSPCPNVLQKNANTTANGTRFSPLLRSNNGRCRCFLSSCCRAFTGTRKTPPRQPWKRCVVFVRWEEAHAREREGFHSFKSTRDSF